MNSYSKYKVCILCGGKGERLKPITDSIPKPLVRINNRPILSYIIDHFLLFGIKNFTIATGYKSKMIEEYLLSAYSQCRFEFSHSADVDIVKRLANIKLDKNIKFIICYGDTIANVDVNLLLKFHTENKSSATVSSYQYKSQFGLFKTNQKNIIESYEEKPIVEGRINIGFFVLEYEIAEKLISFSTFKDFISYCVENKILYNYMHDGYHITVNSHNELEAAKKRLDKLLI